MTAKTVLMANYQVGNPESATVPPPKPIRRVGVIGGGQLAWMMADAAKKLGVELVIQTPSETDPAVAIATHTILAPVDDAQATTQLAAQCDVITFENEFVDLKALRQLARQGVCFRPSLDALEPLLDKYHQRSLLKHLNLPTPQFWAIEPSVRLPGSDELNRVSYPFVVKIRRHGYDGRGTFILKDAADWEELRDLNVPLVAEEFVPFERELAVMAARSLDGTIVTYPVVETMQQEQVCRRVVAPADVSGAVVEQVQAIAHSILTNLQVVGIFGIELFLTQDDTVLVNEIAPRTHNSGHFTLDACETSQFEQQLRAVCGLPLGSAAMQTGAVMVNLLGYEQSHSDYAEKRQQLVALPQTHVHWYGKRESRPGRKLGHVTVLLAQPEIPAAAIAVGQAIESIWYQP